MADRVVYASHPPQFSSTCTPEHLACLDRRFDHLRQLRVRKAMGLVVQDSADLLGVHLSVQLGRDEWQGTPGQLDEDGTPEYRAPFVGWSEDALTHGLCHDLVNATVMDGDLTLLEGALQSAAGLVYVLRSQRDVQGGVVSRRLNLRNGHDHSELAFLAADGWIGVTALHVHSLSCGFPQVQRITLRSDTRCQRATDCSVRP